MPVTVLASQKFSREFPCLICGGWQSAPRGRGIRCWGFVSPDGRYAHCTNSELAGGLPVDKSGTAYAHRLDGPCRCGQRHQAKPVIMPRPARTTPPVSAGLPIRTVSAALVWPVASWLTGRGLRDEVGSVYAAELASGPAVAFRYVGSGGRALVKCRSISDKSRQWWSPAGAGMRPLYLWERLVDESGERVLLTEGELDVHALRAVGVTAAVSVPDGARTRLSPELLAPLVRFRRVVVATDADEEGEVLAARLIAALGPGRCGRVRFGDAKDANEALVAGWRRGDFERALAGAKAEAA